MKTYYLVQFEAEYYCQGVEWATFTRLVYSESFKQASDRIKRLRTTDWELNSPKNFKNLTIL